MKRIRTFNGYIRESLSTKIDMMAEIRDIVEEMGAGVADTNMKEICMDDIAKNTDTKEILLFGDDEGGIQETVLCFFNNAVSTLLVDMDTSEEIDENLVYYYDLPEEKVADLLDVLRTYYLKKKHEEK